MILKRTWYRAAALLISISMVLAPAVPAAAESGVPAEDDAWLLAAGGSEYAEEGDVLSEEADLAGAADAEAAGSADADSASDDVQATGESGVGAPAGSPAGDPEEASEDGPAPASAADPGQDGADVPFAGQASGENSEGAHEEDPAGSPEDAPEQGPAGDRDPERDQVDGQGPDEAPGPEQDPEQDTEQDPGQDAGPEQEQGQGPDEAAEEEPDDSSSASEPYLAIHAEDLDLYDSGLPMGLLGMPAGSELSLEEIGTKEELIAHDVDEALGSLTAGVDFMPQEIVFRTDSAAYAQQVAEAYNGTLKYAEQGVAVVILPSTDEEARENASAAIRGSVEEAVSSLDLAAYLEVPDGPEAASSADPSGSAETGLPSEAEVTVTAGMVDAAVEAIVEETLDRLEPRALTVEEAVTAGMDPGLVLPPVDPNYIFYIDSVEEAGRADDTGSAGGAGPMDGSGHADDGGVYEDVTDWKDADASAGSSAGDGLPGEWEEPVSLAISDYNDPFLQNGSSSYQWHHEWLGSASGWEFTDGSSDITVAVIDTGVTLSHPELSGNVTQIEYSESVGIPVTPTGDHGSHVAGLIAAARGNSQGGAGIAPGVSIWSYNVSPNGRSVTVDAVEMALHHAARSGEIDIVNMSIGTLNYAASLQAALDYAYAKGCTLVSAMGNDGANVLRYPAACNHVIAVAATDRNGRKAAFSNYGAWCDVSAPGASIWSTTQSGYTVLSGTSMACPIVTGAAALYMSLYGHIEPADMEAILKDSAAKSPSAGMGKGVISVEKMFDMDRTAPRIRVYAAPGVQTDATVPVPDTTGYFTITAAGAYADDAIYYTVTGKAPTVKDGVCTDGILYTRSTRIPLSRFAGSTVTIKAVRVNSLGFASSAAAVRIRIADLVDQSPDPVRTLRLSQGKATLLYRAAEGGQALQLTVSELVTRNGRTVTLDELGTARYRWSTSDPSVASVAADGTVTARKAGTATIKLILKDGSGLTASCAVTVKRAADAVAVSGQSRIVPGRSASYTAVFEPASTQLKGVTWEIVPGEGDTLPDGVSLSAKGKLTVARGCTAGGVTIRATVNDGLDPAVYAEKTVEIVPSFATAVTLTPDRTDVSASPVWSKGKLKEVRLYTVDHPKTAYIDNVITLTAEVTGGDSELAVWKSSAPAVAAVSQDGTVRALKAGTSVITCDAGDGSGKKASVRVRVIVPASSLSIVDRSGGTGQGCIASGASIKLDAVPGRQFGMPTVTGAKWEIVRLNGVFEYGWDSDRVISRKLVRISGSGKLSVTSGIWKAMDPYYGATVTVRVSTKDGTCDPADEAGTLCCKELTLTMHRPCRFTKSEGSGGTKKISRRGRYVPVTFTSTYDLGTDIVVSSADPKIAGGMLAARDIVGAYYQYTVYLIAGPKKGTTTITCRAGDGSSTALKFKVQVLNASPD